MHALSVRAYGLEWSEWLRVWVCIWPAAIGGLEAVPESPAPDKPMLDKLRESWGGKVSAVNVPGNIKNRRIPGLAFKQIATSPSESPEHENILKFPTNAQYMRCSRCMHHLPHAKHASKGNRQHSFNICDRRFFP